MGGGYTTAGASLSVPNVGIFRTRSRIKAENHTAPNVERRWIYLVNKFLLDFYKKIYYNIYRKLRKELILNVV